MKFNDGILPVVTLNDLENTISDIAQIVETFYDFGTVTDVKKITVGETNFNYIITTKKDDVETMCFGQLFAGGTSLSEVKHELALREYYMEHRNSDMKCALAYFTKEGAYAVICKCPGFSWDRYFCLFEFMDGKTMDYDEWAFGRMNQQMIEGIATGIANYHMGAYGFTAPEGCQENKTEYAVELARYREVFTEEYDKRKHKKNEYFDYFEEFQPRLLELLDRYTKKYHEAKDELPTCMSHIDSSANNYMFDENWNPLAICDLNWSQERPRIYDLCWLFGEGFFIFDDKNVTTEMEIEMAVAFVKAYDDAIARAGSPNPGRLTDKEWEMIMDFFMLVSIRFGFYNIWAHILTDNPSDTPEYNIYWGNCSRTAMEYVEAHRKEINEKMKK